MSKIEMYSRRASRVSAQPGAHNSSFRRDYLLRFALLGLATAAMILTADLAWAQLHEGDEVVTVTNAYWVRLRSTPEIRPGTVLTRVAGGAQLRYLGSKDEWFKVELPNGSQGWLHNSYGRLDSARDRLRVSASVARVREAPERGSPVVGRAIRGLMLEIVQKEAPWYLVRLPLGEEGWVREDLVSLHAVEPKLEQNKTTSSAQPEIADTRVNEVEEPGDDPAEANLLEITPLPISASASSGEDESGTNSPTFRSPKGFDKPRFLMLFVSVIAGLSAFAVILVVSAVAIRRKQGAAPPPEMAEEAPPSAPHEDEADRVYSDPILSWMEKTSPAPAASAEDHVQKDQDESEPLVIAAREQEASPTQNQPLDFSDSTEFEPPVEEDAFESPFEEHSPESTDAPAVEVQSSEPVVEEKTDIDEPYEETAASTIAAAPVLAEKTPEQERKNSRRSSKSSRSRNRRKGRRRRRR